MRRPISEPSANHPSWCTPSTDNQFAARPLEVCFSNSWGTSQTYQRPSIKFRQGHHFVSPTSFNLVCNYAPRHCICNTSALCRIPHAWWSHYNHHQIGGLPSVESLHQSYPKRTHPRTLWTLEWLASLQNACLHTEIASLLSCLAHCNISVTLWVPSLECRVEKYFERGSLQIEGHANLPQLGSPTWSWCHCFRPQVAGLAALISWLHFDNPPYYKLFNQFHPSDMTVGPLNHNHLHHCAYNLKPCHCERLMSFSQSLEGHSIAIVCCMLTGERAPQSPLLLLHQLELMLLIVVAVMIVLIIPIDISAPCL